jgi:uncharacterized protein (DUF2336 family)
MMASLLERFFGKRKRAPLTYEQARELAGESDTATRVELANRADVTPEILYYLAEDRDAAVRLAVAANPTTPPQADLMLAGDTDDSVRQGVAEKMSRLFPGLREDEIERLHKSAYDALERLARDELVRVRATIAEALKDLDFAPPELVRLLARDDALEVSVPILELSPVLTDRDLLDIIESSPATARLAAISRRDSVSGGVADAIVATDDIDAIADLLANPSAQIREETLDDLIGRAPSVEAWHAPLVRRPKLSPKAAQRLTSFVAKGLVDVLRQRKDLPPEAVQAVAKAVRERFNVEPDATLPDLRAAAPRGEKQIAARDMAMLRAKQAEGGKQLNENMIYNALADDDAEFVICALSLRARVPVEVVDRVVAARSPEGMTALTWKAGMTMRIGVKLQQYLAMVPTERVLHSNEEDFPLGEQEMELALTEFLSPKA